MTKLLKKSTAAIYEKQSDLDDLRLKNIVANWDGRTKIDIGIIGIPFDYGVQLSGGRPGAARAPDTIRSQLKRYGTACNSEKKADLSKLKIADLGNMKVFFRDSLRTYAAVIGVMAKAYDGLVDTIIALGGGNDITYATVSALQRSRKQTLGGMSIDAHFDVRSTRGGKITSGTPYRRLIEDKILPGNNFWEAGIQGQGNSVIHERWLKKQGAKIVSLSEIREKGVIAEFKSFEKATRRCKMIFVSIDIDSVAQAFAPGSSAPSPDGLFPEDILQFAYLAGLNQKVKLFEVVEVNPRYDVDNRTSRLATNIVIQFLTGRSLIK